MVPGYRAAMSANEIIAELPRLNRVELEAVDAKLHELLGPPAPAPVPQSTSGNWARKLSKLAGSVEGLPPNYALNHDHYLHGMPKR